MRSAEVQEQDVGQLLQLISHEVRGPLGVIRGYLRLLEQQGSELSDLHRQAVTAALRAGERAAGLLGQISELARLQRRETIPAPKAVPLEPLLRSAIHAVTLPADPIVTLHVGITPEVSIAADEELVRSALASLTAAVVRAQTTDGRVFLLAREDQKESIRGVSITITPTEAVNPEHADRPLDLTRGGLGLDLPIAAWVIEAHHGEVRERRNGDRFVGMVMWIPLA